MAIIIAKNSFYKYRGLLFITKGFIMGLQIKEYRSEIELKTKNTSTKNNNVMSETEKQELTEYLKKFGIDLP